MSVLLLQVGYTPDYLFLLQTILRTDPQVYAIGELIVLRERSKSMSTLIFVFLFDRELLILL